MIVTISLNGLDGNPATTIQSKDFTAADERAYLERNRASFKQVFLDSFKPDKAEKETLEHITLEYYYKTGSDKEIIATMKRVTGEVMTILEDRIRQTGHVILKIFLDLDRTVSLGYRYLDENGVDRIAIVLGKTSVYQASTPLNETVADRYFGKTPTDHIRATFLHELGHVLHQCQALTYFITLARVQILGGQAISIEEVANCRKMARGRMEGTWAPIGEGLNLPEDEKTAAETLYRFIRNSQALGRGLSYFAQSSGLNEFVAEMFSALSLGLPIDSPLMGLPDPFPTREQVLLAYARLGMPLGLGVLPAPEAPSSARAGVLVPATSFPSQAATTAATEAKTGLGKG